MKKDPTQKEIRQRCLEIQNGWSPEERLSRIADYRLRPGYKAVWTAPVYTHPIEGESDNLELESIGNL